MREFIADTRWPPWDLPFCMNIARHNLKLIVVQHFGFVLYECILINFHLTVLDGWIISLMPEMV